MSDLPEIRDRLEKAPLPDEQAAEKRAWRVVSAAHAERRAAPPRSKLPPLGAAAGVAVAALVLALTPAGAQVVDWIEDVVEPGRKDAEPVLRSIPGGGEILVESREGVWVVRSDGSKRRVGSYSDATWSPNGLFVAAADDRMLVALEPDGDVRWTVPRPRPVARPAWSPSGFRIAYRSGDALRVVAGDGTDDRVLAKDTPPVTPAWRPQRAGGSQHVLAYVNRRDQIVAKDVDTGDGPILRPGMPRPIGLDWSADGQYLVAAWSQGLRVTTDSNRPIALRNPVSPEDRLIALAANPVRNEFAVVTRAGDNSGVGSEVVVFDLDGRRERRVVFAGPGRIDTATWSPDGERLLLGWRDADQWLFLPADQSSTARPTAVDQIGAQFDPGAAGGSAFPRVAGWCCP